MYGILATIYMKWFKGRKEIKRIKCFWDMGVLLNDAENGKESTEEIFGNLRKLEKAYKAKADITVMTERGCYETGEYLNQIIMQFDKQGMKDRVTSAQGNGGFVDVNGAVTFERYKGAGKKAMLKTYACDHEKNPSNILLCLYAGGRLCDEEMALTHKQVDVYKNIPCAFVDTSKQTLSKGLDCLADQAKPNCYFKFSVLSPFNSSSTKSPSLRINTLSK